MKIILALLLCTATLLRAEPEDSENEPPDPNNPPAEVELTPAEREASDLIDKGDASALKGEQEDAMSCWGEALTHKGAGERQMQDARVRLQWACPDNGIGGLGSDKPGQAFAFFRRNSFLGADEKQRKIFIRDFCLDTEHNDPHPEFDAYAQWLQKMLPEDKNFELLPLVLEGDLAENRFWLSQNMPEINNYDFPANPELTLQVVKLLGGAKTEGRFVATMFDENGNQTLMGKIIDCLSRDDDHEQKSYERTRVMLKKFLGGIRTPTLDSDLMLVLLNRNDEKVLAVFLKKHGVKMAAFEPEELKAMLSILESVKECPKTEEMDDLLHRGDASALAGDRDAAKALWGQVMTITPAGIVPRKDAMERLAWARPNNGVESWQPVNAGKVFANHMRDQFLGADAPQREAMIKNFCSKQDEGRETFSKIRSYADWLNSLWANDKDLNFPPLILEGELGHNKQWLSLTLLSINRHDVFKDPSQAIKLLQGLGFLGDTASFRILCLSADGSDPVLGNIVHILRIDSSNLLACDAVRKYLTNLQPRTFGADFTLALLEDDVEKSLTAFLKTYATDLAGMDQGRRDELLGLVKTNSKGYPNTEEMNDDLVSALRPLLPEGELKTIKLEDQLAEILAPDRLIRNERGEFLAPYHAAKLITSTADRHPEKAITGLKKALGIIAANPCQKDMNFAVADKPLATLLGRLFLEPALFNETLKLAEEAGLLDDAKWVDHIWDEWDSEKFHKLSGREMVACFLSSNRFSAEAENFDPLYLSSLTHPRTVLGAMVNKMILVNDKMKEETLNVLRSEKPQSFGSEIVEIMTSHDEQAVRDFIRRRSPEFVKIPAVRRDAVLNCLYWAWDDLRNTQRLLPELKTMLQPLFERDPVELNRKVERFLSAPSLASLNLRPMSCLEPAQKLLEEIAETDVSKALRLADKVRELIKNYPENHEVRYNDIFSEWKCMSNTVPELFGIHLEELASGHGSHDSALLANMFNRMPLCSNVPFRALKILQAGKFLDAAPSFRSYRHSYFTDADCFLYTILRQIKRDERAVAIAKEFLNKQNQTFGVGLVKALLDENPNSIFKFIESSAADLEKIPLDRLSEVTLLCGIRFGSWLQLASVSPEWNMALKNFLPGHKVRIAESCDKLLAAKRMEDLEPGFKDLDPAQSEPRWKWLNIISEMKMLDTTMADEAFSHLQWLEEATSRDRAQDKAQKNSSKREFYVENYISSTVNFPALFGLCLSAAVTPDNQLNAKNDLSNSLNSIARQPVEACILIDAMGFLSDASSIDPTQTIERMPSNSSGGLNRKNLILTILVDGIKSGGNKVREPVIKHLSQHKPKAFGSDFLLALLAKNSAVSVPAFLKAHQNEMSKLRAESRTAALALLREAWPEMPQSPDEKKE